MRGRSSVYVVYLVLGVVLAATGRPAMGQSTFAWHSATIGQVTEQTMDDGRLDALRAGGVDAVMYPALPSDTAGWKSTVDRLRRFDLRVLLQLPDAATSELAIKLTHQAGAAGFDGVVLQSTDLDPAKLRPWAVEEGIDPAEAFVLVQGIPVDSALRGAEPGSQSDLMIPAELPFDVSTEVISALPSEMEDIEALFSRRARTAADPTAAPIAVPGARVTDLWYLLPGAISIGEGEPEGESATADFRSAHPAVAGGVHEKLSGAPYTFYRGMRLDREDLDEVVIVLGAEGKIRINVASVWTDDTVVRDAVTGRIAIVSYGQATLMPGDSGIVLLEELD